MTDGVSFVAKTAVDPASVQVPSDKTSTEVFIQVGDKKYSPEDAAKKIQHADSFIETLKAERAEDRKLLEELKGTVEKSGKLDEVIKALNAQKTTTPPSETAPDMDAIVAKVSQVVQGSIAEARQKEEQDANFTAVTSALTEVYGADKVNDRVAQVASELGMTVQEAAVMARTRPQAFMRLFPEMNGRPASSGTSGATVRFIPPKEPEAPSLKPWQKAKSTKDAVRAYQEVLTQAAKQAGVKI